MLQNPVTSTPFLVNDILRPEREQIGLEALQLQAAGRSRANSQYLLLVPEPRKSEAHNAGSRGGAERRRNGSEPPGEPSELVTEMDAEPVGEYTLRP